MLDGRYLTFCLFTETISTFEGIFFVYFVLYLPNPLNWDVSYCVIGLFEELYQGGEHRFGFMVFGLAM